MENYKYTSNKSSVHNWAFIHINKACISLSPPITEKYCSCENPIYVLEKPRLLCLVYPETYLNSMF